ncbi:MAG: EVE domain-containing protein [Proteobacteria bacterium]|nr:EVE domain-containing protein [Pseudomonadota bacterium]
MNRNYWLDLFTGKTWEEFLKHGANVSGFRERRRKMCEKVKPGDYFICYLTGLSRFVGILEVKSKMFIDHSKIWEGEDFPCRFKVDLIYRLEPKTAIPVLDLSKGLSIFKDLKSEHAWTGFFRGSPALFDPKDGEATIEAIKKSVLSSVVREYDEKKYWRQPRTFESKKVGVVTVPEETIDDTAQPKDKKKDGASHEEIQWLLLKLGSDLGLDVWVARNDRNREYEGKSFQKIPSLRKELPRQFDDATNRTIELIDVLWLQGDAILAAFEVEHTSSIYSGLLRMSDLVSMQPNIKLNLYLVAPDDRREKVFTEINRPTFARLKPPLPKICKFISYVQLKKEIEAIGNRMKFIKPEFIDEIAESCEPDEL